MADLVAPSGIELAPGHLRTGDRLARSLQVVGYPRQVSPGWLDGLYAFQADMRLAVHVEPLPTRDAVAELTRRMQDLRATLIQADRRLHERDPYVEAALEDAQTLRDGLARGRSKLFRVQFGVTLFAADLEELDRLTRLVEAELEAKLVVCRRASFEQEGGFRATLPVGEPGGAPARNMDTAALATMLPFVGGGLVHPRGEVWGVDLRDGSLVMIDRFAYLSPHTVTVAASGAGKSYWLKAVLTQARLAGVPVIAIDPSNREYRRWCLALGGQYVHLGVGSADRINPLAPEAAGGEAGRPGAVERRVDFAASLCEVMLGSLTSQDRALLDRVLLGLYGAEPAPAAPPTIADLVDALVRERATESLARRLMPFARGSLAVFNGQTNVELAADLIVFDVHEIVAYERALAPAAYFILARFILDSLQDRAGRVVVAIDEAHFLLRHPATARFLEMLLRAGRKLGAGVSLVTQSIGDFYADGAESDAGRAARACLANASIALCMRQQNDVEVDLLARAFRLSRAEQDFVRTAGRGEALVVAGNQRAMLRVVVPPDLHPLITSEPEESARPPPGGGAGRRRGQRLRGSAPTRTGGVTVYNQVTLVGRLTRDAELGQIPNDRQTPKLRFTVAVDREYEVNGETPTDFWPVVVLGEYGARLAPHLTKGRLILVSGAAHLDSHRTDAGEYKNFAYVGARSVRFLDHRTAEGA